MPIIPPFKAKSQSFQDAFEYHLSRAIRSDPLLSQVNVSVIHEGRGSTIVRNETEREDTEVQQLSSGVSLTFDQIDHIALPLVLEKVKELADSFRRQQSKSLLILFENVTQKTGQVIDGGGALMDHELLIKMMRMMPPSYDPVTGEPTTAIVVHPDVAQRMVVLEQERLSNPAIQKALDALEAEKRDEYRTEEMARSVVG